MKKNILSAVLSLALIMTVPVPAVSAAEAFMSAHKFSVPAVTAKADASAEDSSLPTSGECGDNARWTFKNGALIISGTGKMYDYTYAYDAAPWYDFREDIKCAIIEKGITSIDRYAFIGCKRLTSVTVPDSVTYIRDYAFYNCENLTSIKIPGSVTYIGDYAFCCCKNLKNITVPDSVDFIGESAFEYCSELTSITIPDSVTYIERSTFSDCKSLTSVTIPDSVTSIDVTLSGIVMLFRPLHP